MCHYEHQQQLLKQLKVSYLPCEHSSKTIGSKMSANIISISANEVIAVDNTSWLSVHVFTIDPTSLAFFLYFKE